MGMGDRIKERRIFMGYTQEELGNALGLQKSAIAKYENGRVENIKRSVISKMSEILQCSPSYLMDLCDLTDDEKVVVRTYTGNGFSDKAESELKTSNFIPDELSNAFIRLNTLGRKEAIKRVNELTEIPRYTTTDNNITSVVFEEPLLNAAHERTDIEVTEEMKQHDDDIMDDSNF